MSASKPLYIGIDLGTTYSCAALYKANALQAVPNENGPKTTPSMVYFGDKSGNIIVGETAKNGLKVKDSFRSICYNSKRLLGKTYAQFNKNDVITAEVINCGGYPYYQVIHRDEEVEVSPSQISGYILGFMKKLAETFAGKEVKGAVITVPAYFSDIQRRETEEAAKLVDLNVIHIINEPTAAAIAYNFDNSINTNKMKDKEIILVYDLGGGTFDISLVAKQYDNRIKKNILKIIGISGDNHLGGDDFDQKLLEYYINKSKEYNIDMFESVDEDGNIVENKRQKMKLKLALQKAKELLVGENTSVSIDYEPFDDLDEGYGLNTLTRSLFNNLNKDTLEKTIKITMDLLHDKNMTVDKVDQVLLCGGSTRIVYIQDRLKEIFGEEKIKESINADEIVAKGACILAQYPVEEIPTVVQDVLPRNLGLQIEVNGVRKFDLVVEKFTPIPFNLTKNYETAEDNQEYANFVLYEGQSNEISKNMYLGHCTINDLPRGRAGQVQFQVTFSYGFDGMLKVIASNGTNTSEIQIYRNLLEE